MKFSRLLIGLLALSLLFVMSGCWNKLSTVDYNNEMVDHLNPTLDAMESSIDTYEAGVPLTVYSDSTFDMEGMQATYDEARTWIDGLSGNLMLLESWNSDQQAGVRVGLTEYEEVADEYLDKYEEMLEYYGGDFASDLDKVAELDSDLYELYNKYIDEHNTMVDTLASYT